MPAVSVIVPVYNDAEFLGECLRSIAEQTLRDLEIVCIDDASTDESLLICEEFSQRDARFKVLPLPENGGVSSARNLGLEQATGDFIAFMDADDWYPANNSLEILYRAAVDHGASISAGSLQRYNQKTREIMGVLEDERELLSGFSFVREGVLRFEEWQNDYGFYRFLYRRELIEEHGLRFPPLIRHEDPLFLVQALLAAGEFYAVPEVVYSLRMGYKSVQLPSKAVDDALEGVFRILALCEQNGLTRLRERQKVVLRRYFVDAQGMLGEFYLKDLLKESCNRIAGKAAGALSRSGRGGAR